MGMFDYFRSSYDLGEPFTNAECHTKDIEDGIGGTMTDYWVCPRGYLYKINYASTHEFHLITEEDPSFDTKTPWRNFEWVPNGTKGKVEPVYLTKYIEVYPGQFDGKWEHWPRCRVHFRAGRLMDFEDVTGR